MLENSDKKKGWEDLMESTKTISNCTIDLLAVITGADLKRLTIALSQLKVFILTYLFSFIILK